MTNTKKLFLDSKTMFHRCQLSAMRKPDTIVTSIFVPVIMMLLFVFVFGGAMEVGEFSFVNFIVPGVILQCISQCAASTAVTINDDMTKGIFDRFRSMPIAKSAVLTGHVLAAMVRNIITTVVVFLVAFLIGFRPSASFTDWLLIAGVLLLFMLAFTWISVIIGVVAKNSESASGMTILAALLPYLSSGFAPIDTMPAALRVFATHQPMTPVIDTVRALTLGFPLDGSLMPAILWCAGISIVCAIIGTRLYQRKMTT